MYSAGHGDCTYIYTRVIACNMADLHAERTQKKKQNKTNKNKNTRVKFYSNNYTKLTLHARCMHSVLQGIFLSTFTRKLRIFFNCKSKRNRLSN